MALITLLAESAAVTVVFLVAAEAGSVRFAPRLIVMAAVAGQVSVGAVQGKIGVPVVEAVFQQACDVGFAAFMVGMAGFAGAAICCRRQAVIADTPFAVVGYGVVAVQAAVGHRSLGKGRVAALTVRLNIGVCFCHRSGHQNLLLQGEVTGCQWQG